MGLDEPERDPACGPRRETVSAEDERSGGVVDRRQEVHQEAGAHYALDVEPEEAAELAQVEGVDRNVCHPEVRGLDGADHAEPGPRAAATGVLALHGSHHLRPR
ncbi:MAG: hypothetical protein ABW228_06715, partial [Thermoleophilaceae bacterium]